MASKQNDAERMTLPAIKMLTHDLPPPTEQLNESVVSTRQWKAHLLWIGEKHRIVKPIRPKRVVDAQNHLTMKTL
jgi:hypothetical protein